tara:strand:+ start:16 stop:594 length:579 start_codon:yes stop_codon:yes gene_type:complete
MALTRLGPNQSINLTSNVTGTLPIANGGTNLSSGFINGTTAVGKILQVVSTSVTSAVTSSTTSYADIGGYTLSITPSATSSKILFMCYIQYYYADTDAQNGASTKILRNIGGGSYSNLSAQSAGVSNIASDVDGSVGGNNAGLDAPTITIIDSPNTTSVVNYKMQGAAVWGGSAYYGYDSITGYLIAQEIGA